MLAAAVALTSAASGQQLAVDASCTGKAFVAQDNFVVCTWTVDLGPSRFLSLVSPSGRFRASNGAGQILGEFGVRQFRANATGLVSFSGETVGISADVVRRVHRLGSGGLTLERSFTVESPGGLRLQETAVFPLRIEVPVLNVDVYPKQAAVPICGRTETDLVWTVDISNVGPLEVVSSSGKFLSGDRHEYLVPIPLGTVRTLGRMSETVDIPDALSEAAQVTFVRTFDFKDPSGGNGNVIEKRTRSVTLTRDRSFRVTVTPRRISLTPGALVTVPLVWQADAESCQTLVSDSGRFKTLGGRLLGTETRRLVLTGSDPFTENLSIPAEVLVEASQIEGAPIRYVREFREGDLDSRAEVILDVTEGIAAPFAIRRLELRFSGGEPFRLVERGQNLAAVAELTYAGTGLLEATWEVADPGTTLGTPVFRPLRLERRNLSGGGRIRLSSPALPTDLVGGHQVRLRITAPSPSFEEPVLRYQVGEQPEIVTRLPPPPRDAPLPGDEDTYEPREIIVLSADMEEALVHERIGLQPKMRRVLDSFDGLVVTVFRVPAGAEVGALVAELRERFPMLWADANHHYRLQQSATLGEIRLDDVWKGGEKAAERIGWSKSQRDCDPGEVRVGLIDTPVDPEVVSGIAGRKPLILRGLRNPSTDHGTAVAGLIHGAGDFEGLIPNAPLYVAEAVYQGTTRGLGGFVSSVRLALAIDWLISDIVEADVILMSVAGPRNALIDYLVRKWLPENRANMRLVAPFDAGRADCDVYPAAYGAELDSVVGVIAVGDDGEPISGFSTACKAYAAPAAEANCGYSCATPFVTAALWVGNPRRQAVELGTRPLETGWRIVTAPPCPTGAGNRER